MVKPYLKHEQLKETYFIQDHTIAVYIGLTRFDKVFHKKEDGSYSPFYENLDAAKQDRDDLQECLKKYQISDPKDIYRLDDPSWKEVH